MRTAAMDAYFFNEIKSHPKSNIYYFNLLSVLYTDSKRPACAHDAGKGFRAR